MLLPFMALPNYFPTRAPISLYSGRHLLSIVFLKIAILTGVRCYITVILICMSLMINVVEHFSYTR
jgi:hypothetical protein